MFLSERWYLVCYGFERFIGMSPIQDQPITISERKICEKCSYGQKSFLQFGLGLGVFICFYKSARIRRVLTGTITLMKGFIGLITLN